MTNLECKEFNFQMLLLSELIFSIESFEILIDLFTEYLQLKNLIDIENFKIKYSISFI